VVDRRRELRSRTSPWASDASATSSRARTSGGPVRRITIAWDFAGMACSLSDFRSEHDDELVRRAASDCWDCDEPADIVVYSARPSCFMYVALSQNRYSSVMTPSSPQWPRVAMGSLNALPVGGIDPPSAVGIGSVNVPSMIP